MAVALAGAALTGCGDDDSGQSARLQEAACADLRDGMSVQAVAGSGVRNGLSERRVASILVLGVPERCPEFQAELDDSAVPGWLD